MTISPILEVAEVQAEVTPAWQPGVMRGESDPPAETDWFRPLGLAAIAPNGDPPALMLWGEDTAAEA